MSKERAKRTPFVTVTITVTVGGAGDVAVSVRRMRMKDLIVNVSQPVSHQPNTRVRVAGSVKTICVTGTVDLGMTHTLEAVFGKLYAPADPIDVTPPDGSKTPPPGSSPGHVYGTNNFDFRLPSNTELPGAVGEDHPAADNNKLVVWAAVKKITGKKLKWKSSGPILFQGLNANRTECDA